MMQERQKLNLKLRDEITREQEPGTEIREEDEELEEIFSQLLEDLNP